MPKRHWSTVDAVIKSLFGAAAIICILWGVFDAGRSHGVTEGQKDAQTASYASQSEQDIEQRCLSLDRVGEAECIANIIDATNEAKRAERDSKSQTDTALWAFWSLIVTLIVAIISAIGIWFVWRTLDQTNKSLDAA